MGGKKVIFGIVSFLISFNFLFTQLNLNLTESFDIKSTEKQKQQLEQKNTELKRSLAKTNDEINKKNKEIKDLQKQIESVNSQLKSVHNKIIQLNKKIESKKVEVLRLEHNISEKMALLMQRVRIIYKFSEVGALEILFGAKTFDELIDKLDLVSRLSAYDSKLVAELNSNINLLNSDRVQLEKDVSNLSLEETKSASKQNELNELRKKHEDNLKVLNEEKQKEQSLIDENNAAYKELQNRLDRYYEEQARKHRNSKLSCHRVVPSGKRYAWPTPGFSRLSSLFMEKRGFYYHKGIDIAKDKGGKSIHGANVVSADDGVVILSFNGCVHDYAKIKSCGCGGGYGNYVFIDHGAGRLTGYGHLSAVNVKSGQRVTKGQVIGKVGSTGHSTGDHLHFECRKNNVHYDPLSEYN